MLAACWTGTVMSVKLKMDGPYRVAAEGAIAGFWLDCDGRGHDAYLWTDSDIKRSATPATWQIAAP